VLEDHLEKVIEEVEDACEHARHKPLTEMIKEVVEAFVDAKDCSRRYFGGPLQDRAGPRRASTGQTRDATDAESHRADAGVSTRYKDFSRRIRHTNDARCNVRRDALGAEDRRFTMRRLREYLVVLCQSYMAATTISVAKGQST
jgi:hypothetical protein